MQDKKVKINSRFTNSIKLFGAVLVLYFGFKIFIFSIGEPNSFFDETFFNDSGNLVNILPENIDDGLNFHGSSSGQKYLEEVSEEEKYKESFEALCALNKKYCEKVEFVGDFSSKDKFTYFAGTIYVLDAISKSIQIGSDINTQLKTIVLSSEYGVTRGSANRNSVTIRMGAIKSYTEYLGLIAHELGHIVDLGVIKGYKTQKDKIYTEFGNSVFAIDDPSLDYYALSWSSESVRKSDAIKEDFCSGYGMSDPFEDFAECHNMYMNHNDIFKQWAKVNGVMKKKYNFFANLYNGKYIFGSSSDLQKFNVDPSWRPWDTTTM